MKSIISHLSTWRRASAALVLAAFVSALAIGFGQAAVTNTAAFGQTPFMFQAKVTAAKANIGTATNTNTVALIATGSVGTNGAIVSGLNAIPNNTVTASWVCVYYSTDSGTTLTIWTCGTLAAYTAAATLGPTALNFTHPDGSIISPSNPLYLPYSATTALYAGAGVAVTDGIVFTINGVNL